MFSWKSNHQSYNYVIANALLLTILYYKRSDTTIQSLITHSFEDPTKFRDIFSKQTLAVPQRQQKCKDQLSNISAGCQNLVQIPCNVKLHMKKHKR